MNTLPLHIVYLLQEFCGSSCPDVVLDEIKEIGRQAERDQVVKIGEFTFREHIECTCWDACGGLFCNPIKVFTLIK